MNQERIVWPPARRLENPDDKMSDDFTEFIGQQNFTTDQMRAAYDQLMGVAERNDADPNIVTILNEMKRLEGEGYPINRFVEFIQTTQKLEDAVPVYRQFIKSLPVSANEKQMLCSLVEKNRTGVLEVIAGGKSLAKTQIEKRADDKEFMATELMHMLRQIMSRVPAGQSIEFTFTE